MTGPINMPSDLVSLRASIDSLEMRDALFQRALTAYLEALGGVETHVFQQCATKVGQPPPTLEPERLRLRKQPDAPAFDAARARLDVTLREASDCIKSRLAGAVELGEVLKLLAQTTASLQRRGSEKEDRLGHVASSLRAAAESERVEEFRERILAEIGKLNHLVAEMREENRQMVEELEREMQQYRKKLDEAREVANRDTLTGLSNRRVLQEHVEEHIRAGLPFCLLLIDLNRFKAINDQHGHLAGDELLRLFSERLRNQLRQGDAAARWGGDEFVVILPCSLPDAMARAQLLERNLHGEYVLKHDAQPLRVRVGLSIGVAEHKQGETADKMLARADTLLYARKQPR